MRKHCKSLYWLTRNLAFHLFTLVLLTQMNSEARSYNLVFSSGDTIVYHANQFFVSLEDAIPEDTIVAFLLDLNATEVWRSGHLDMALWEVNSFPFVSGGQTISNIHDAIARSKKKTKIHNATLNVQQTLNAYVGAGGGEVMSCFDINDFTHAQGDSSTIKISILDTGISDMTDNTTSSYNYNLTTYTGYDYVNDDNDPDDEHGHGTHLTGLIHSITHQTNPTTSFIEFDIRKTHDSQGQAFLSTIVFALLDALEDDADIINLSFGYENYYHDTLFFPLQVAIQEANYRDALVVIAAGNNQVDNDNADTINLPASFPTENILSVASLDCGDQLSVFSNYGAGRVDISVLGEDIPGPDLNSGLVNFSGTSQAAAIITATAALRATQMNNFKPNRVICPILRSADHLFGLTDKMVANGKLNFDACFAWSDSTCLNSQFDCLEDFTGANSLTGTMTGAKMLETNQAIHSAQVIEASSLMTMDALQSTTLLPGFEVQPGGEIQIVADGCTH